MQQRQQPHSRATAASRSSCSALARTGARASRLHMVAPRAALGSDDAGAPASARQVTFNADLSIGRPVLTAEERVRLDENDDAVWYAQPRIGAIHTDGHFKQALRALYAKVLQPHTAILDLASSYESHLPPDMPFASVLGLGLNVEELSANRHLNAAITHDLNRRPALAMLPPSSLHAVLCANGLAYLTRPEWVLADVARVLKPGGTVVVAFSRHNWANKAVAGWLQRTAGQRLQLVARMLRDAGFTSIRYVSCERLPSWPPGAAYPAGAPPSSLAAPPSPEGSSELLLRHARAIVLHDAVPAHLLRPEEHRPAQQAQPARAGPAAFGSVAHVTHVAGPQTEEDAPAGPADEVDPLYAVVATLAGPGRGGGGSGGGGIVGLQEDALPGLSLQEPPSPSLVARGFVAPALQEIELISGGAAGEAPAAQPRSDTLERWRGAYRAMCSDAQALGIPRSALPELPPDATLEQIRAARDKLEGIMASFLSSGL